MTPRPKSAFSGGTPNGAPIAALNGHSNGVPKQPNGAPPPPAPKSSRLFSGRFSALGVMALVSVIWATISAPTSEAGTYAVCSQNGERIYTVDANNTKVQCIVVNKAHIADTGTLCTFPPGDDPENFTNLDCIPLDSGHQKSLGGHYLLGNYQANLFPPIFQDPLSPTRVHRCPRN